jgi:acyl carrier protein
MTAQAGSGGVQAVLVSILERNPGAPLVTPGRDTRLQGDLGLDSLSMIDLAVAAEDAFGIRIPDDELERFVTVGDVVDYVQRCQSGN